mgnify:CR=1 FL=1
METEAPGVPRRAARVAELVVLADASSGWASLSVEFGGGAEGATEQRSSAVTSRRAGVRAQEAR